MIQHSIIKLRTRDGHFQLRDWRAVMGLNHPRVAKLYLVVSIVVMLVLFVMYGPGIALAQGESDGNKFPLPPASDRGVNEPLIDSQTGLPLAAGSLAIQAVQGTPGAAKVGAAEVEIDLIQDGQIIDHIETQLDEFGVLVLRDLPIAGGIIPLVRVHYGEVKYQQPGEMMDPAHPQQRVRVVCYETTEDKPDWTMTTRHIMATKRGSGLFVSEFIVVNNPSERTWLGDGHGEPGSATRRTVEFAIPEDAKEVYLGSGFLKRASVVEPGLIASRLPLMPGKNEFKFEYHFHADGNGEVEYAIPQSAPVDRLMVIIPNGVQVESSEGIAFDKDMAMEGGPSVGVYKAENLQAGQMVTMKLGGITGTEAGMGGGEANLATTEPIISRSSGMGVKLIAGFGAAVLLLIGIAFILMKSPKEAVEGDK